MSKIKLVGIVGAARSGKNHISSIICEETGYIVCAYALPIKMNTYAKHDTWSLEEVFGNADKPDALRNELQQEGTELGRYVHRQDMWVRAADAFVYIAENYWNASGVVFSDVRMPNEAEHIKSHGGLLLKVIREGAGLAGAHGAHESESYVSAMSVDGIIDNTGHPAKELILEQLRPYLEELSGE